MPWKWWTTAETTTTEQLHQKRSEQWQRPFRFLRTKVCDIYTLTKVIYLQCNFLFVCASVMLNNIEGLHFTEGLLISLKVNQLIELFSIPACIRFRVLRLAFPRKPPRCPHPKFLISPTSIIRLQFKNNQRNNTNQISMGWQWLFVTYIGSSLKVKMRWPHLCHWYNFNYALAKCHRSLGV